MSMNRAQRRKNKASVMPSGKSGGIELTIATKENKVIVEFPQSIRWFALGKQDVANLIAKLQQHSDLIKE